MAAVRPITLVDQVVDAIVQAAAEGRILPGDRVVEADISRELGVSRVPVREALRLLESQGIVINAPYRGMRLMPVDAARLHQILVVRAGLERIAAREAVSAYRRDRRALAPLEERLEEMRQAAKAGSGFMLARADTAFHRALCTIAGNEVLVQIWETLARRLTIIVGLSTLDKDLDSIYREHVEFLEILRHGTPRAVERAVDEHIVRNTELVDFRSLVAQRRGESLPERKRSGSAASPR